ncbi:MAG: glycosyltransferase [Gammaproteobacteria bacterium]
MTETQPRHRPVVSVVMATYNGRTFLREQLDSIAAQTQQPDELLIIDDGSSDGTPELLAEWARDKPWVRLDRNPRNLGINATFWRLLTESTGDYVFISDQDDVWMPEKIEQMMGIGTDVPMAFSDAEIIDDEGKVTRASELSRHDWIEGVATPPEFFVHGNFVSGHNMMVSRELIRATPEPPHSSVIMYDQWLTLSAVLQGGYREIARPLARHRIHARNANNNSALNRAARATQTRRERALQRLEKRCRRYEAFGGFVGKNPRFDRLVGELQAGSEGIASRWWSATLFRALWTRRQVLLQGKTNSQTLRFCIKTSLGGRAWRFM